eukprot:TRINITY_DN8141_c0_g1_i3.p1 TRINITY_DN8141_c0_g1~~TRINITY_DN8141_c0_g1_i3.p1  ORF type:complete len:323 (+),score=124.09 TRINITY_DN8141_c0_g1_i3:155-1123(+)
MDYILLVMYNPSRDTAKLSSEKLLLHLGELIKKSAPSKDSPGSDYLKGDKEKSSGERYKEPGSSSTKKLSDDNLMEDEILGMMQKCLGKIAESMMSRGLTVKTLFKDNIYTKTLEGKKTELITHEDFMKGLKELEVKELSKDEEKYLKKMLTVNDDEKEFKISDLVQIFEEYAMSGEEDYERDASLENLDKISMVLLLALFEYMGSENVTLNDIFGKAIYKQPVQIDDDELEIEIINSSDFFEIINTIGIETEESQHDNLKSFLCIDPAYLDKFSVERLNMILKEFDTNKGLSEQARKYYQELIEDDQLQEEGEVDNLGVDG